MAPFLQQVFTHLIAHQGALLILYSVDFRILHLRHVEAHEFMTDDGYRGQLAKPCDPTHDGIDLMLVPKAAMQQTTCCFVGAVADTVSFFNTLFRAG